MFAEMPVALCFYVPAAQVAHAVSADAGQFVAAALLHEAGAATRTGAFDGCSPCGFDSGAEGEEEWLVTCVRVVPMLVAEGAGGSGTGWRLATEA